MILRDDHHLGTALPRQADLVTGNVFVLDRFLRGAPFLASPLYANMGMLGLFALLPADER